MNKILKFFVVFCILLSGKYVFANPFGGFGGYSGMGDMRRAVYDADYDGIIDSVVGISSTAIYDLQVSTGENKDRIAALEYSTAVLSGQVDSLQGQITTNDDAIEILGESSGTIKSELDAEILATDSNFNNLGVSTQTLYDQKASTHNPVFSGNVIVDTITVNGYVKVSTITTLDGDLHFLTSDGKGGLCMNAIGQIIAGTTACKAKGAFHVISGLSGVSAVAGVADDIVVESDSTGGISLITPNANASNVYFGSPADISGGMIRWEYGKFLMQIGASNPNGELSLRAGNSVEAVRITKELNVSIGKPTSTEKLQVSTATTSGYGLGFAGAFTNLPTSGHEEGTMAYQVSDHTLYISTEAVVNSGSWKSYETVSTYTVTEVIFPFETQSQTSGSGTSAGDKFTNPVYMHLDIDTNTIISADMYFYAAAHSTATDITVKIKAKVRTPDNNLNYPNPNVYSETTETDWVWFPTIVPIPKELCYTGKWETMLNETTSPTNGTAYYDLDYVYLKIVYHKPN